MQPMVRSSFVILSLAVLVSGIGAQNFHYEPGDWQHIPTLATIASASEGRDGIYFSTYGGVLRYDHFSERLDLLPDINMGLPSRRIYQVFTDPSTDALWVVHDDGIDFRLPTDETWREVPFLALPDHFQGRYVTRIGGSFDGIWVDMDGVLTLLNSFTGDFLRRTIALPDDPVTWNTGMSALLEPPDLVGWVTGGDWTATVREFLGPGFISALPTFRFSDSYHQVWFGTDVGVLFRGDLRTRYLEPFQAGIAPDPVITMYRDGNRVWFADNPFRRRGARATGIRNVYFLSAWDEAAESWRYYSAEASQTIQSAGINDMLRVGRYLWLATMEGIVLLNTRTETWDRIGPGAGLRDRAVWDLESLGGQVFAATIYGVDRIDPRSRSVLPEDSLFVPLNAEVYDLLVFGRTILAGSAAGIFLYEPETADGWQQLSDLPARSLWVEGNRIFAVAHNLVYQGGIAGGGFELLPVTLAPGIKILEVRGLGSYIWLATSQGALLYDRQEKRQFSFGLQDGLPSEVVYHVEVSPEWVWFLTGEGVVRFNWRTYIE